MKTHNLISKTLFILLLLVSFVGFTQNQFEKEILAFEKQDSLKMPVPQKILLVGSSSLRLWNTWQQDLQGFPVINRGFGGSQMSDANYYFDRIVSKYKPALILLYEGDNDINAGKSPEVVFADFKEFVGKVKTQLPKTKVVYISIRPSLARLAALEKQKLANSLIEDYCKKEKKLKYLNVHDDFFLPSGELMPDIFVADKLHLNAKGYTIWTKKVRGYLEKNWKK